MKPFVSIAFVTVYGLVVRLLFGFLGDLMSIMGVAFLILMPLIIGFLTIILLPKSKKPGASTAFFLPFFF
jgi:hypothetical protein